ncbi:MAG TPA: type II toxin-antitoxin system prevent-host-death family antitoxin [Candidatus Tumulicola sp.]|nr:type II toxin-antitoxin system prevent-host-death family antitoxin [Candidatus Tumulicola sp.]
MTMKRARKVPATISASEFKATCLELMDAVYAAHVSFLITKRGQAVARLCPVEDELPPLFGSAPVKVLGDIVAPVDATWDASE